MSEPLLHASSITVSFGGLRALENVTLAVPPASIVGLIGPNGAGKTTLFGVLSGLLRPDNGTVVIDGNDLTKASPQARAKRGLARTFQRLELFGELSVREHLVLAHRVRSSRLRLVSDLLGRGRRAGSEEAEEVEGVLALLGLTELADVPARSLPLGTGRLVEVARAVAARPRLLLLDEPSSGLDELETSRLAAALGQVRRERDCSLVVVEHNVELVLGLADRVTVLDFGRVIAEGTPVDVRADPAVRAAYLGAATP